MLSALDARYGTRLGPISEYMGEINFVYFMSVWSMAYAECTNEDIYLPVYTNKAELYHRVRAKEKATKHQMVALLQVLQEDFPDVTFHYGLTSEDIMHNARWTQIDCLLEDLQDKVREVEENIREYENQVSTPILAHTHGQAATPIKLGPYLRAKCRHLSLVKPEFRLGGSNGQLTALKYASDSSYSDLQDLAKMWLKKVASKVDCIKDTKIMSPSNKSGLLQIGPKNDACFLTAISLATNMRSLARALWDHCQRKILKSFSGAEQAGSSAMPHKVNPIQYELSEGCFTIAINNLETAYQANADSRGLRDLSNSVVNRQSQDGWAYLYLGLTSLNQGMQKSIYNEDEILAELKRHPDCLTEIMRYYMQVEEGKNDPYWELKKNPPKDFEEAIERMKGWDILG